MTGFVFDTLLFTAVLIALVLVLRRPMARQFGPQAAYALWALPLLRLLLPPIELPASMAPVAESAAAAETVVVYAAGAPLPVAEAGIDWATITFTVWAAGAVLFLVWRTVTYLRMRRDLLEGAIPVGEAGPVRLVECPTVSAPVAFGVRDKVIALPIGFMAWHDRRARDLALAHELAHHQGHDLLINMLAQPVIALHWFNPLAWAGWRAMRRDQEAACDARVLAGQGGEVRADYGRLIAGLAGGPRLALAAPMACPILGEKSIIHRLRSLSMPEPTKTRRRLGRGLLIGAALALPLTATIGYAAPDMPTPPDVPAAPQAPDAPKEQKQVHRIVIVEKHGDGKHDDAKLKTRVIERGGKTIVLKTDKDLTEAEVESRIAKVEADMLAMPPEPPAPPAAPGEPRQVRRVIVMSGDGQHMVSSSGGQVRTMRIHKDAAEARAIAMAGAGSPCKDGKPVSSVTSESDKEGQRHIYMVRVCGDGDPAMAATHALGGLKSARARIAGNSEMSAEIKAKVLEELDREIARLSKGG
ncbi:MAG: M56 family metallopeptidase [Novosphingobium sp.]